jgi:DNA modification methylase
MDAYYLNNTIGIMCTPTFINGDYLFTVLQRYIDEISDIVYISDSTNLIKTIGRQLHKQCTQVNYDDFRYDIKIIYIFSDGNEPAYFKEMIRVFSDAGKEIHYFKTHFIDPRTGQY